MVSVLDDLVGKRIGGYLLDSLVGTGGTSAVFLSVDREHEETPPVAVKILISSLLVSQEMRLEANKRFQREVKILSQLDHSHILPVLAFGEDEALGYPYIVMPYKSGGTLASTMKPGNLPVEQVIDYVQQVAQALDYAHEQNIIHRDIKPANVLLDEEGYAFLADFSIAKSDDIASTTLTSTHQTLGTPAYMAPEQISNQGISPATDVYGLGMLTYQMLTGRLPFAAGIPLHALYMQILQQPPLPPADLRPDLPAALSEKLLQALAKEPSARFSSAGAFARSLEQSLHAPLPIDTNQGDNLQSGAEEPFPPTQLGTPIYLPPTLLAHSDQTHIGSLPGVIQINLTQGADRKRVWQTVALSLVLLVLLATMGYTYTRAFPVRKPTALSHYGQSTVTATQHPVSSTRAATDVPTVPIATIAVSTPASLDSTTITATAMPQNSPPAPAVTGNSPAPPTHAQVQTRMLSVRTQPQSLTVNATGQGTTPATYATGKLQVINTSENTLSFPVGTIFYDEKTPAQFLLDEPIVNLPPGPAGSTAATDPSVIVQAHTNTLGSQGNIATANTVNSHCHAETLRICTQVTNATPFTGGADAQGYVFVQQSDIDGAANQLKAQGPDPRQVLQNQLDPNEHLVGTPVCSPATSSNQVANDKAANVTVTAVFTCIGEAQSSN